MEGLSPLTSHLHPLSPVSPLHAAAGLERVRRSEDHGHYDHYDNLNLDIGSLIEAGKFRSDALSDIKWGLGKAGTIIKIVSAVLTLLGADSNIDRNDDLEDTIGTWMDVGATVLKVGIEKFSDGSPATSSVNKLGVAASTAPHTSPEIQAYIASLTPDQIKLKQQQVLKHVQQEAIKQGLNSAQADALLAETLQFNGLPQINSNPLGGLGDLIGQSINKIGLPAAASSSAAISSSSSSSSDQNLIPGLPVPGTMEHTVTLALFNAQQYINNLFRSKPSQPAIDNKIGVAAGATQATETGILGAVSSLPQSVTSAAVQVLKFVNPTSATGEAGDTGSQSYSEVVTGVDPSIAALGVLTTGALASVAYSYVASDNDIASSATNLALGAVDAISRNDIMEDIAKNDIVQKITNNDIVQKATTAIKGSKFLQKASSALEIIKRKIKGEEKPPNFEDGSFDVQKYYNIDYSYDGDSSPYNTEYTDVYSDVFSNTWDEFQTNFDYQQEVDYSDRYPYQESSNVDRSRENPPISSDDIEWYEPSSSTVVPEQVPYIPYSDDSNPWHLMSTGQSTEHLYRAFKQ